MVLGGLPVPGRPTIWITVGQGHTALAVGAGGGCLDIFTLICSFSPLSPSLWETARYRLKYCLKGPLNPKQPTVAVTVYRKTLQLKACQASKGIKSYSFNNYFLFIREIENLSKIIYFLHCIFSLVSIFSVQIARNYHLLFG